MLKSLRCFTVVLLTLIVFSSSSGCSNSNSSIESQANDTISEVAKTTDENIEDFEGLLPIGSVVLLTNGTKRVMIIGVCQKQVKADEEILWDYVGCLYPEGYMGGDQTYLFNGDQIETVSAIGYQDEEQHAFKIEADAVLKKLREAK